MLKLLQTKQIFLIKTHIVKRKDDIKKGTKLAPSKRGKT